MKIAVIAHAAIDNIISKEYGIDIITTGGSTGYAGLMLKALELNPKIITKVGDDFIFKDFEKRGLFIDKRYVSEKPSTRFKLVLNNDRRELFLISKCEDIISEDIDEDYDASIVSPIINEISYDTLDHITKHSNFTYIDPQGFVRRVDENGRCYIARTSLDISKDARSRISAIKVDEEEALSLTGRSGIDALRALDIQTTIFTRKDLTLMLHKGNIYRIAINSIKAKDSTGIGDIFAGAYTGAFLQDKDAVWSLSYAVAAAITALKSKKTGLDKVPLARDIKDEANIIYERVKRSSA